MKKIKMIRVLILLLSLVIVVSCKKEKLTKATQTGANTFSCKVNGKVYVASSDINLWSVFSPYHNYGPIGFTPNRPTGLTQLAHLTPKIIKKRLI